ncbi:hypothetical protein Hanom_Chr12g01065041 [Helianthus anomalus]
MTLGMVEMWVQILLGNFFEYFFGLTFHLVAILYFNNNVILLYSGRQTTRVDHFKMALDCFFVVWFVVGVVWMFGGRSSYADAPNLYR